MTPTQRTQNFFRHRGYIVERCERWQPLGRGGGIRKDFLGLMDFMAMRPGEPIHGVQSCGTDFAAHVRKALAAGERLDLWLSTGSRFTIIGWRKLSGVITPRIATISYPLPLGVTQIEFVETKKVSEFDAIIDWGKASSE